MQPIDLCTLAYSLVSLVIVIIRLDSKDILLPFICLVLVIAVALYAPRTRRAGAIGVFVGEFYPVFLTIALYSEVGMSNRAVGISYDSLVQSWEAAIFGGQPSLKWMSAWPNPILSAIFHISYLSYYLIVIGVPLYLWFTGRRLAARRTILIMMVTYYICYTIFRLFPVAGPRFVFPLQPIHGTAAAFAHNLVAGGSAWGTAFPSSHVAVAFVNSANAYRAARNFGWIVWVMSVLLAFATVYGQFHYAVDAIAGVLLALGVLATWRLT